MIFSASALTSFFRNLFYQPACKLWLSIRVAVLQENPMQVRVFISVLMISVASPFAPAVLAQTQPANPPKQAPTKSKPKTEDAEDEASQRRTVAISLVTTLADEARSFKDQTR